MAEPNHPPRKIMRRVAGSHDWRLDGITDLILRARGASVLDIGCNRGMVLDEFYRNGARRLFGCDNYEKGIETASEIFADRRDAFSVFRTIDLTTGVPAFERGMAEWATEKHDIVLLLATYHKLKRIMDAATLSALVQYWGKHCTSYFGWRGTSDKEGENWEEVALLDVDLARVGLKRVHTSSLSEDLAQACIWARR